MAIKHKTVGTELSQAEFEATDLHEGLDTAVSKPSRAFGTVYQNGAKLRFVFVMANLSIASGGGLSIAAYVEAASPPTVIAAALDQFNNGTGYLVAGTPICFFVPAGLYYKVTATAGAAAGCWAEYDLA